MFRALFLTVGVSGFLLLAWGLPAVLAYTLSRSSRTAVAARDGWNRIYGGGCLLLMAAALAFTFSETVVNVTLVALFLVWQSQVRAIRRDIEDRNRIETYRLFQKSIGDNSRTP